MAKINMRLILVVFTTISISQARATDEVSTPPKCLSIPPGMEKTPTTVSNEIMASAYKLTNALRNSNSVKPLLKYWDEIRCLAEILTSGNTTALRQIETFRLQQIIRDTVMSHTSYIELPQNLPKFITAVGMRDGYDFLLTEMRDTESLFYGKATVFDIALVMRNDSGLEKAVFDKLLPAAVQSILGSSEKPVFLKNAVTGSFLNFNAGCKAGGAEANCSSFALSKERGDRWKFVPAILSSSSGSLGTSNGFKMFNAKQNASEARLRIPSGEYHHGMLDTRLFVFSLEDEQKISIKTPSVRYTGGPCFGEDGNGTFVTLSSWAWEDRGSHKVETKIDPNCVRWTVVVE